MEISRNAASIELRFRSMTMVRTEASYKYNNFNLLGFFFFKEKKYSHRWEEDWDGFTLHIFFVDVGGTLGLYFGLTILTLFELLIFVFYRDANDPFKNMHPPPQHVIYSIPRKTIHPSSVKLMLKRQLYNNNLMVQHHHQQHQRRGKISRKNPIVPSIFWKPMLLFCFWSEFFLCLAPVICLQIKNF